MAGAFIRPRWDLIVADYATLTPLVNISTLATQKRAVFQRGKPHMMSCVLPAFDRRVNTPHTDGEPYVTENRRVLLGIRTVNGVKTLRYVGRIRQCEDQGEGDKTQTTITAWSAHADLYGRLCRNSLGDVNDVDYSALPTAGATIGKALVDRTNAVAPSTVQTTGTFDATSALAPLFMEGTSVGEALETLAATQTLDVVVDPVATLSGGDPILGTLSILARQGADRPAVVLGWGTKTYNVKRAYRLGDGMQLSNDALVAGNRPQKGERWTYGEATDLTSQAAYGLFESWTAADPSISDTGLLDDLAAAELALRKNGREYLRLSLFPDRAPLPWDTYWLGDTVHYWQSAAMRKQIDDAEIVVDKISVSIDDNGYETVPELLGRASA